MSVRPPSLYPAGAPAQRLQARAGESVSVLLEQRGGRLVLVVEDHGAGFTPGSQKGVEAGSFGLVNRRERAALAGGELTIDSTPGHGTTLIVRVLLGSEDNGPDDETQTPAR